MVVVQMHRRNQILHRRKTLLQPLFLWKLRKMGVADIEVKAQAGEPCLVHKSSKVVGATHFTQSVLYANGDPGVMRVQDQMLQRTESRIAFARVGGFPRTAHVQDEP